MSYNDYPYGYRSNPLRKSTRTVAFTAGDGTQEYIEVACIAEYPRGADGLCAYCHGDPCAERPESAGTQIGDFYWRARHAEWRVSSYLSCPCCEGRPT